jgi:chromosome segregation ATPase
MEEPDSRAALEARLAESTATIEKYKAAMDKALPKLKDLKAQLDEKTELLVAKETLCSQLSDDNSRLRGEIDSKNRQLDDLKNVGGGGDAMISGSEGLVAKNVELLNALNETTANYETLKATSRDKLTAAVTKIKDMKAELDARAAEIQRLTGLVESVQDSNNSSSGGSEILTAKIAEIEALKAAIAASDQKNNALATEVEEVKNAAKSKITTAIEKIKEMKAVSDEKTEEIVALNRKIAELESMVKARDNEAKTIEAEEDRALHEQLTTALAECQRCLTEKNELNNRLEELLSTVGSVQTELESCRDSLSTKNHELDTLTLSYRDLSNEFAATKQIQLASEDRITYLEGEVSLKNTQLDEATKNISDLESSLSDKNAQLAVVTHRAGDLEDALATLRHSLSGENDVHAFKIAELEDEKRLLQDRLSAVLEELTSSKHDLSTSVEETASLKAELSKVSEALEEKGKENALLSNTIQDLNAIIRSHAHDRELAQSRVVELEEDVTSLSQELKAFGDKSNTATAEIVSLTEEKNSLDGRLQEILAEMEALRKNICSLETDNAKVKQLEEATRDHSQESIDLKEVISDLQAQLHIGRVEMNRLMEAAQIKEREVQDFAALVAQLKETVSSESSLNTSKIAELEAANKDLLRSLVDAENSWSERLQASENQAMAAVEAADRVRSELEVRDAQLELLATKLQQVETEYAGAVANLESYRVSVVSLQCELDSLRIQLTGDTEVSFKQTAEIHEQLMSSQRRENLLSDEVQNLAAQLADANTSREALASENSAKEQHIEALTVKVHQAENDRSNNLVEEDNLRMRVEELQAVLNITVQDLTSRSEASAQRVLEIGRELAEAGQREVDLLNQIEELNFVAARLQHAEEELQLLRLNEEGLRIDKDAAFERNRELATSLEEVRREYESSQFALVDSGSRLAALTAEMEGVKDGARAKLTNAIEKIKVAKAETAEKTREVEGHLKRIAECEVSLGEKQTQLDAYNKRIDELHTVLADKQMACDEAYAKVDELEVALADAVAHTNGENSAKSQMIELLQQDNTHLKNGLSTATTQLDQLRMQLENLEHERGNLETQCERLATERGEMSHDLGIVRAALSETEAKVHHLEVILETAKDDAREKLVNAVEDINEVKAESALKNRELNDVMARLSELEVNLACRTAEADAASMKVTELESVLAEVRQGLSGENESNTIKIAELEAEKRSLYDQLDRGQMELEQVSAQRQSLFNEVRETAVALEATRTKLASTSETYEGKIETLNSAIEAIKLKTRGKLANAMEKVNESDAAVVAKNEEITVLNARIMELELVLSQQISEVQTASVKATQLETDLAAASQEMNTFKTSGNHSSALIEQLSFQFEDASSKLSDALKEVEDLKSHVSSITESLAASQLQRKSLSDDLEISERRLDSSLSNVKELEGAITHLHQEYADEKAAKEKLILDLEDEIRASLAKASAALTETEHYRSVIDAIKEGNEETLGQVHRLTMELNESRQLLAASEEKVALLIAEVETARATAHDEVVEAAAKIDDAHAELARKVQELEVAISKISNLESMLAERSVALAASESKIVDLAAALADIRQGFEGESEASAAKFAEIIGEKHAAQLRVQQLEEESDILKERLTVAEKTTAELRDEVDTIKANAKSKLETAIERIKEMKEKLDIKTSDVTVLSGKVTEQDAVIFQKNDQLNQANNRIAEMEAALISAKEIIGDLEGRDRSLAISEHESGILQESLDRSIVQCDAERAEKMLLLSKVDLVEQELSVMQQSFTEAQACITSLTTELEEAKADAKSKLSAALEIVKELETDTISKSTEIENLRARIHELEVAATQVEQVQALESAMLHKESELQIANIKIADLLAAAVAYGEHAQKIADLEAERLSLVDTLIKEETESKLLKAAVLSAEQQVTELAAEVDAVKANAKSKITNAVEKIKEMKQVLEQRNSEIETATLRISELEGLLDGQNHQAKMKALEDAEQQQHQLDNQLAALKLQIEGEYIPHINRLQAALDERESNLLTSSGEVANYLNELSEYQVKCAAKTEECNELLRNIVDINEQLNAANEVIAANAALIADAQRLEKELATVKKVKDTAEKRLMTLQLANEALRQQAPPSFQVLARAAVEEKVWCLTRMEKSKAELDGEKLLIRLFATTLKTPAVNATPKKVARDTAMDINHTPYSTPGASGSSAEPHDDQLSENKVAENANVSKDRINAMLAEVQPYKVEWRLESTVLDWISKRQDSGDKFSIGKMKNYIVLVGCSD